RVAGRIVLEAGLGRIRQGRVPRTPDRGGTPAALDHGRELRVAPGRTPPRRLRHRDLVRPAARNLHARDPDADREKLRPGSARNGGGLPREDRSLILPLRLDVSRKAKADAVGLSRGTPARSEADLLYQSRAGRSLFE